MRIRAAEMIGKAVALLIALMLVIGAVTVGAAAGENDAGRYFITGTFTLSGQSGSKTETYCYSDGYFSNSGKDNNEHLRTMSAALAFMVHGASPSSMEDYRAMLRNIGFGDLAAGDLDTFSADSIGSLISRKTIDGRPVVLVCLRGSVYENEWASNFNAGADGDAQGFAESAAKVEERLLSYMSQYDVSGAKLWIVGYSRGGAVANLVGRDINRDTDLYGTSTDDIYVYTFEAPNCSADGEVYENIHNVADCRDFVTYVYPSAWGLGLNGVREEIGAHDQTVILKSFILSEPYCKDVAEIDMVDFLNEFAEHHGTVIGRSDYAQNAEEYLCRIIDMYFSMSGAERAQLNEYIEQVVNDARADSKFNLVLLSLLTDTTGQYSANGLIDLIQRNMDKAAEEVAHPFSDEEYEYIRAAVDPLAHVFVPAVSADLYYKYVDQKGRVNTLAMHYVMTFGGNLEKLIGYHYGDSVFAGVKALDSYYDEQYKERVPLFGDADRKGGVTIMDATAIQRFLAELVGEDALDMSAADADGDGTVTIMDATAVQRYLVGFADNVPIGLPIAAVI